MTSFHNLTECAFGASHPQVILRSQLLVSLFISPRFPPTLICSDSLPIHIDRSPKKIIGRYASHIQYWAICKSRIVTDPLFPSTMLDPEVLVSSFVHPCFSPWVDTNWRRRILAGAATRQPMARAACGDDDLIFF
jgi:hypothetical protein